jgi:hypothetical protein
MPLIFPTSSVAGATYQSGSSATYQYDGTKWIVLTPPTTVFASALSASFATTASSMNAGNLNAGTVPVLRLGASGTRNNTTFLRGDNTWATVAGVTDTYAFTVFNSDGGAVTKGTTLLDLTTINDYNNGWAQYVIDYTQTTAGTGPVGAYWFALPSGYQFFSSNYIYASSRANPYTNLSVSELSYAVPAYGRIWNASGAASVDIVPLTSTTFMIMTRQTEQGTGFIQNAFMGNSYFGIGNATLGIKLRFIFRYGS